MKALSDILVAARRDLGLTQQEVAAKTKIELKYIQALEAADYSSLPPATFTKGFIRKYASVIDKDPDELVAIFRREYREIPGHEPIIGPAPKKFSFNSTWGLIGLGLLTFLVYLAFQYRALLLPPFLTVTQPAAGAVLTSPVIIEGKTSSDSIVTVNQDSVLRPDQSGHFLTQFNFSLGQHRLEIKATNRFGRSAIKSIDFTIISQ